MKLVNFNWRNLYWAGNRFLKKRYLEGMGNFPLPWGNDVENQGENFVLEALVKISTFIFLLANAFSSKTRSLRVSPNHDGIYNLERKLNKTCGER